MLHVSSPVVVIQEAENQLLILGIMSDQQGLSVQHELQDRLLSDHPPVDDGEREA